jgi:hypothetical protein
MAHAGWTTLHRAGSVDFVLWEGGKLGELGRANFVARK